MKRRRLQLGLTQQEVATAVGRKHPWLSALERGEGNPPAEAITGLAVKLAEEPSDYLRMAGRTVLVAEGVVPAANPEAALAAVVERAIAPVLDRLERVLALLEERPGAG